MSQKKEEGKREAEALLEQLKGVDDLGDLDLEDPEWDYRRVPAEKHLNETGRDNISLQTLYDNVLSQPPNLRNWTIQTCTF